MDPETTGIAPSAPSVEPVTSTAAPSQSSADIGRLVSTIVQEAPAVQEHAVSEAARQESVAASKDSKGITFNSALHAADASGKPIRTAGGEFAKKRGRKAGAQSSPSPSTPQKSVIGGVPGALAPAAQVARAAGENAANLLVTVCRTFGGEEWAPIASAEHGLDEMANLRKSYADYFQAKNMQDIPPGIALTIATIGYMGPRFFAPVTRGKLSRAKEWLVAKYLGVRAARAK